MTERVEAIRESDFSMYLSNFFAKSGESDLLKGEVSPKASGEKSRENLIKKELPRILDIFWSNSQRADGVIELPGDKWRAKYKEEKEKMLKLEQFTKISPENYLRAEQMVDGKYPEPERGDPDYQQKMDLFDAVWNLKKLWFFALIDSGEELEWIGKITSHLKENKLTKLDLGILFSDQLDQILAKDRAHADGKSWFRNSPTTDQTEEAKKITQEILARRLLYLPIDLGEKILMWLTYKGLKPVSEITVIKRNLSKLRKGIRTNDYDLNSPKSKRIRKWLKDAGLFRVSESKYPGSWHIGKNLSEVKLSVKVIRKFDYENEILSGKLFGFPPKSVIAYAINRSLEASDPKHPVLWPGDRFQNPYLKDKYFTP